MFSLRPYHSLREEEENPYGKSALYSDDISSSIVTCSTIPTSTSTPTTSYPSSTSSGPSVVQSNSSSVVSTSSLISAVTTTTTTFTSTSPFPASVTTTSGNSFKPFSSSLTLQSIKAAWRSLTSLSFTSSRLPHLERAESSGSSDSHQHDYRYTQFPTTLTTATTTTSTKRHKESTFHPNSIQASPAIRTYTNPHRSVIHHTAPTSSEPLSLAKCLRKHREKQQARALTRKSKSDNALQKIGVHLKSSSDQNIHKVCIIGCGNANSIIHPNSIFSNVHISGDGGDSSGSFCSSSSNSSRYHYPVRYPPSNQSGHFPHRSRSLERTHGIRIHHPLTRDTSLSQRHTQSLERNHKFRIDLRLLSSSSIRDQPPDHPAPPPPIYSFHSKDQTTTSSSRFTNVVDTVDGSGGSLSLCSTSSTSSSNSVSSFYKGNMESGNVSGSFINKPPRGWLHSDQQLAEEGICYGVRYIGALEINTSMKSLNFDTRSLIAKECISKVCEAAGLKTVDRKRKVVKSIGRILGEKPLMDHAGSNITLTITSTSLTLTTLESCQVVACHDMPNISFASGGDPDTLDFIAYVAKDSRYGRACFVLECGGGLAQDVITTIGQAFELRFKEYMKNAPSVQYTNVKPDSRAVVNGDSSCWTGREKDVREYYNDLPGKLPPDPKPPPVPPLPQYSTSNSNNLSSTVAASNAAGSPVGSAIHSTTGGGPVPSMLPNIQPSSARTVTTVNNFSTSHSSNIQRASDNLIDLTSEASVVCSTRAEPEYVNDAVIKQRHNIEMKDPFDMQPFSMQLTQLSSNATSASTTTQLSGFASQNKVPSSNVTKPLPLNQLLEMQQESWFHGPISRKEAEQLLKQDGDFLVRESQGTAGQYVLTGMQNNTKKHLLLVDPNGVVRTKSRTFDSVSHLINYHRNNELPIVSAESALVLRNPVIRPLNNS